MRRPGAITGDRPRPGPTLRAAAGSWLVRCSWQRRCRRNRRPRVDRARRHRASRRLQYAHGLGVAGGENAGRRFWKGQQCMRSLPRPFQAMWHACNVLVWQVDAALRQSCTKPAQPEVACWQRIVRYIGIADKHARVRPIAHRCFAASEPPNGSSIRTLGKHAAEKTRSTLLEDHGQPGDLRPRRQTGGPSR